MASLLLTGVPGVGKTTVLRSAASSLGKRVAAGFLTEEIRPGRGREGFRLTTLGGEQATIAHVELRTPFRVGKYGVDVPTIDRLVDAALRLEPDVEVFLVDEIGRMECLSAAFVQAMRSVMDSGKPVVASVARSEDGFMGEARRRRDSTLWEVTRKNRDALPGAVVAWIEDRLKS